MKATTKKRRTKTKMLSIRPKNLNKCMILEEGEEEEVEEEGEEARKRKRLGDWYI